MKWSNILLISTLLGVGACSDPSQDSTPGCLDAKCDSVGEILLEDAGFVSLGAFTQHALEVNAGDSLVIQLETNQDADLYLSTVGEPNTVSFETRAFTLRGDLIEYRVQRTGALRIAVHGWEPSDYRLTVHRLPAQQWSYDDGRSDIGDAVLSTLNSFPEERGSTWNERGDAILDRDWLLQSPSWWGRPAWRMPIARPCKWSDARCHTDFEMQRCNTQADCTLGGECQPVRATVTAPGELEQRLCMGQSDSLFETLYDAVVQAKDYVDLATLSPPDGRFLAALRNAFTYLSNTGRPVRVRVLFGNIPLPDIAFPTEPADLRRDLTRDLPASSPLKVWVGAYRQGVTSWNHSKIVAIDDHLLIQGGHNWWTKDYLLEGPVHDLSMKMTGTATIDSHRFLNRLWEFTCEYHIISSHTQRSVFPSQLDDCPPAYGYNPPSTEPSTHARVMPVGRLGSLGANPNDDVLLTMLSSARASVKISTQDIGPTTAPIVGIPLQPWPQDILGGIAGALVRGVDVFLVLSGGSGPGGGYHHKYDAEEVPRRVALWLEERPGLLPEGKTAHEVVCDRFHVTTLRFTSDEAIWPAGAGIANHAKFMMADDSAFYLGSHNIYSHNLSEYGVVVDDVQATNELLRDYWEPLWEHSSVGAVSGFAVGACDW